MRTIDIRTRSPRLLGQGVVLMATRPLPNQASHYTWPLGSAYYLAWSASQELAYGVDMGRPFGKLWPIGTRGACRFSSLRLRVPLGNFEAAVVVLSGLLLASGSPGHDARAWGSLPSKLCVHCAVLV